MSNTGLIEVDMAAIAKLDETAKTVSLEQIEQLPRFQRAISLTIGMQKLRTLIEGKPLQALMLLQNTKLGFRTDKEYPPGVVRDCLIEGIIRGASPVGNEINIIGGNCYLTKEYYERRLSEMEGLSNLRIVEGVPQKIADGALVPMWASWTFNGHQDDIRCVKEGDNDSRIAVRVNAGMGADAILGKAQKKLMKRICARVTGSRWMAVDADDDDVIEVSAEVVKETAPDAPEQPWTLPERWREKIANATTPEAVEAAYGELKPLCRDDQQHQVLGFAVDERIAQLAT